MFFVVVVVVKLKIIFTRTKHRIMFLLVKHIFKMAVKKFAEYLQKEASNENNNLGHAEVY